VAIIINYFTRDKIIKTRQAHTNSICCVISNRDDDDINDVATMGGVNLSEETHNILATNSGLVSGQLRSCKDERFLDTSLLLTRINAIGIDLSRQPPATHTQFTHIYQLFTCLIREASNVLDVYVCGWCVHQCMFILLIYVIMIG